MSVCASCGHSAADPFQFCPKCGTRYHGGADHGLIGRTLVGKYRILEQVGAGGMGTVYRAEHVALRRTVAIKILHRELQVDNEALQRFQREGIAAGHLQHPNAIQVFDFDRSEDGQFFLAMEFVDGQNLRARLQAGAMPTEEVLAVVRQLLMVLTEAHRAGIVHRDLKPENLMLVASDAGPQLKVLDFGLSKLIQRPLAGSLMTYAGRVLGTPLYMAPEQWRGEDADHRTDLFAVGVLMFEMLTGQPPFQVRDLGEAMVRSTATEAPELAEVAPERAFPDGLEEIVRRAMAKSRADRWQDAEEIVVALDALGAEPLRRTGARRSTRTGMRRTGAQRAQRPHSETAPDRRRVARMAVVGGLLAAIALVAWTVASNHSAAAGQVLVRQKDRADRSLEERTYVDLLDTVDEELRRANVATALAVAEKAVGMPCADAEAFLWRGRAYLQRGDFDTAAADLSEAELRHPLWPAPPAALGWLWLSRGDRPAAESAFARALDADADDPEAAAGVAAVMLANGQAGPAREHLLPVCEHHPDCAVAQLQLGLSCLQLADHDRAVAAFAQARRRDSRMWQASEGLGDVYRKKGDLAAAGQQYKDALALAPATSGVRQKLVLALLATGRASDAEPVLPMAAEGAREPLWPTVRALAACERSDFPAAVTWLGTAAEAGEPAPKTLVLLGVLHCLAGDHQAAAAACERAAQKDAACADNWLTLGVAAFRGGDAVAAAAHFERALQLTGADPFLHRTLGVLHRDWLLQPDAALFHFQRHRDAGGTDPLVPAWIKALIDAGVQPATLEVAAPAPRPPSTDGLTIALDRAIPAAVVRLRGSTDVYEDHSTWDKAWEAQSRHFLVRTTHSRGLAVDLAGGLDVMLGHLQTTLGVTEAPTRRYHVYVFPTIDDYNKFGNATNADQHSSCYGSFHAAAHADAAVAAVYDKNLTWLRMLVTHSMVHQYVHDAFPRSQLPTWAEEGLAAHFATWWDYGWGLAEFQRFEQAGKLVPLERLLADPIAAYVGDAHERFTTLGMLFYWLLRYREDTATRGDDGAFRDWLVALLRADPRAARLQPKALADLAALQREFVSYEFPR